MFDAVVWFGTVIAGHGHHLTLSIKCEPNNVRRNLEKSKG